MGKPLEARCSCHRRPLLAVCGRGTDGRAFIHVKAWKAQRLLTEVIITDGEARIRCRDCERWTKIKIVYTTHVNVREDDPPSGEILSVLEAAPKGR
jgi:hypothetical protein